MNTLRGSTPPASAASFERGVRRLACPSRRRCGRGANRRSRSAAPSAHARDGALHRALRRFSPTPASAARASPRVDRIGERAVERGAIIGAEFFAVRRRRRRLRPRRSAARRAISLARQKRSATTATPFSTGTTAMKPRLPLIAASSIALHLAAEHRAIGDRGIDHAGQARIDAEFGRAGDFDRRVEPRLRSGRSA